MILVSKYFGKIDTDNLAEDFDSEIDINGQIIPVSMSFSSISRIGISDLGKVDEYLNNIVEHELVVRKMVQTDYVNCGMVKAYFSNLLLDTEVESSLSELRLLRIILFPEIGDSAFAVYDFTADEDLTDDLIVVTVNKDSTIHISVES